MVDGGRCGGGCGCCCCCCCCCCWLVAMVSVAMIMIDLINWLFLLIGLFGLHCVRLLVLAIKLRDSVAEPVVLAWLDRWDFFSYFGGVESSWIIRRSWPSIRFVRCFLPSCSLVSVIRIYFFIYFSWFFFRILLALCSLIYSWVYLLIDLFIYLEKCNWICLIDFGCAGCRRRRCRFCSIRFK